MNWKFQRTAFIRNKNHLIDFKCLTDPKRLNSSARLIILIRYVLKELCISTMQHSWAEKSKPCSSLIPPAWLPLWEWTVDSDTQSGADRLSLTPHSWPDGGAAGRRTATHMYTIVLERWWQSEGNGVLRPMLASESKT